MAATPLVQGLLQGLCKSRCRDLRRRYWPCKDCKDRRHLLLSIEICIFLYFLSCACIKLKNPCNPCTPLFHANETLYDPCKTLEHPCISLGSLWPKTLSPYFMRGKASLHMLEIC